MAATNPSSKPTHLDPSELGTKEYWDSLYTTELTNHAHNPADRGTVWFDDSDAEAKLIDFLEDQTTDPCATDVQPLDQATTSFLDLGSGNGSLLFALREAGWQGRALGADYSEKSVTLAQRIAATQQEQKEIQGDETAAGVEFAVWDVLRGAYEPKVLSGAQRKGWDVVLDKGTFDAISLSEEREEETGRRVCERYKARVLPLVREGGLFLVTSCNWTEEELQSWFGEGSPAAEGIDGSFVQVGKVQYPSFSFGGVKGQTISTLCFQRR